MCLDGELCFVVLPTFQLWTCKIEALWGSCWLSWFHPGFLYDCLSDFPAIVWVMVMLKYMSYYLAAAVLYTNTAVVGVRLWGIHMLCICGVEVYWMYVIYVNIISQIVGTVQGLGIITPGLKADFQSSHKAARCECLHLIKINRFALWLDESAHACTRSELRGALCEDWKTAFNESLGWPESSLRGRRCLLNYRCLLKYHLPCHAG
jgi:uncharacterized RDD family membrane protein YckC